MVGLTSKKPDQPWFTDDDKRGGHIGTLKLQFIYFSLNAQIKSKQRENINFIKLLIAS